MEKSALQPGKMKAWLGLWKTWGERWSSHAIFLGLLVLLLVFQPWNISLPSMEIGLPTPAASGGGRSSELLPVGRGGWQSEASNAPGLVVQPVLHTTIPERPRRSVITYTVQPGDTVLGLAAEFKLKPETIMWANGNLEQNPDLLRPGQVLTILPVDGVYHIVREGDTLEKLAKTYKVDVETIVNCEYNDLKPGEPLKPGQALVIPGGEKPYVPRAVTAYKGPIPEDALRGTGIFIWPTYGVITDPFGYIVYKDGRGRWHSGLDIANSKGAPVYAADSGFVTYAGWNDYGYGRVVVIDHGNGFVTYYAHLQVYYVEAGQSVTKGTVIGAIGSTGNSTGPHLHFEIRHKGVPRDPLLYLPQR